MKATGRKNGKANCKRHFLFRSAIRTSYESRYQEIEVEYYDSNWKKQRQKLSGWTAQICQHEIDHLSGKII